MGNILIRVIKTVIIEPNMRNAINMDDASNLWFKQKASIFRYFAFRGISSFWPGGTLYFLSDDDLLSAR